MLGTRTPGATPDWLSRFLVDGALALPPVSGGDGSDDPPVDDPKPDPDDDPIPDDLGDKGRDALKAERAKRRDASNRLKATEARLAELEKAASDAAAAKAKADEEAAAKRGEFEQLATKREQERDAATAERDALKSRLDAIDAERAAEIEAGVKQFPKDLPALAFDPGADADLDARWRWYQTAAKQAGEATKTVKSGNGRNPLPLNGDEAKKPDQAARARFAQRYQ